MMTSARQSVLFMAAWGVIVGLVLAAPTAAQTPITITCHQVLGPGGSYVVQNHLDCDYDATTPFLTVVGPVEVDFNGIDLECQPSGTGAFGPGVVVTGEEANLRDAEVEDCDFGLRVEGNGQHTFVDMQADSTRVGWEIVSDDNLLEDCRGEDNVDVSFLIIGDDNSVVDSFADCLSSGASRGFRVEGNQNRLTNNRASRCDPDGFEIRGDHNTLVGNRGRRSIRHGFRITGTRNSLQENEAEENDGDGFNVGDDGNTLKANWSEANEDDGFAIEGRNNKILNGNIAMQNGENGFYVDGGSNRTKVTANFSSLNGEIGILVDSDDVQIKENEVTDNVLIGIHVDADEVQVKANEVTDNGGSGIVIAFGREQNSIKENTSTGNGGFDLAEWTVAPCRDNTWRDNIFGSSNVPCID